MKQLTRTGLIEAFRIFAENGAKDILNVEPYGHLTSPGPPPERLQPGDAERLAELGWEYDKQTQCWRRLG